MFSVVTLARGGLNFSILLSLTTITSSFAADAVGSVVGTAVVVAGTGSAGVDTEVGDGAAVAVGVAGIGAGTAVDGAGSVGTGAGSVVAFAGSVGTGAGSVGTVADAGSVGIGAGAVGAGSVVAVAGSVGTGAGSVGTGAGSVGIGAAGAESAASRIALSNRHCMYDMDLRHSDKNHILDLVVAFHL